MPETPAPKTPQKLLPPKQESAGMSFISNALAIAGFIILTFIVMWGVVHLASLSGFNVGSLFTPSPKLEISVPSGARSGQPLTIVWKNESAAGGSYSFLYQCVNGFEFATRGMNGALNKVPCGASINVGSSTTATMVPVVAGTAPVPVPVSVLFTPTASGSRRIEGGATISVAPAATMQPAMIQTQTPAASAQEPARKTPAPSYAYRSPANYAPAAHAASGPADLSVRIIATGYIDPGSGALLMNRAPTPGDVVGVEFDIANVGGSASGPYYFAAHLPTASAYTYTSTTQNSLAPGAHIVNTLRFTQLARGGGMFTVVVDPANQNSDANRANNEAAVTIY